MKKTFLSALIAIGIVGAIFQVLLGSEAALTQQSYPFIYRSPENFKTDSPAPTPTPPGGIHHLPLAPESYPLVCRGAGSLVIGIAPGERNIGFTFTRGTKPAGEKLAPGECSWRDRGVHADEPDRVSQHIEEGSESLKVGGTLASENRWYEELHSSDKYWIFQVYNNGKGQLIVTSARPDERIDVSPTARVPSGAGGIGARKTYPLVCRGSESLVIGFAPSVRTIGFSFTRGTKPAGEGLAPGECSWVDRGMYPDEPDRLSQEVEDTWESLIAAGTLAPENRWYEELHSSRKSWTFMVYNHRSNLHVTSARSNE
jgi:hypothetical protein